MLFIATAALILSASGPLNGVAGIPTTHRQPSGPRALPSLVDIPVAGGFLEAGKDTLESGLAAGASMGANMLMSKLLGDNITDPQGAAAELAGIQATNRPQTMEDVQARLNAIFAGKDGKPVPLPLFQSVGMMMQAGLGPENLTHAIMEKAQKPENSLSNKNERDPPKPIFPQADPRDPPYKNSSEEQLRGAIHIPDGFTWGKKPVLLLFPGTGSSGGGDSFGDSLIKSLANENIDMAWVNIPDNMLDDAQNNAEYFAYGINYMAATTGQKINVAGWSQGGLDTQWVLTFWPSTRDAVANFFPVSADFHGTVMAKVISINVGGTGLIRWSPSVVQQESSSTFIQTLTAAGGDSAWVPTTAFHTSFIDPIVQPQQGDNPSGALKDDRKVGVLNVDVQAACRGMQADSTYEHSGVMYHPIVHYMIIDAIKNGGPAKVERIDMTQACSTYTAPGLGVSDVLGTVSLLPIAGYRLLVYGNNVRAEPPVAKYAVAGAPKL